MTPKPTPLEKFVQECDSEYWNGNSPKPQESFSQFVARRVAERCRVINRINQRNWDRTEGQIEEEFDL